MWFISVGMEGMFFCLFLFIEDLFFLDISDNIFENFSGLDYDLVLVDSFSVIL